MAPSSPDQLPGQLPGHSPSDASGAGGVRLRGRVVRVDRGVCTVLAYRAPLDEAPVEIRAQWRAEHHDGLTPCAGDEVEVTIDDERAVLSEIAPRRTSIARIETSPGSSQQQVLAANIDVVAICEPCHPDPTLPRIERMLAIAWESGAQPVIVLTKSDLAEDIESTVADVETLALGVDVITTVAPTGTGVESIHALVQPGETLALLGRSGAGKSTLLNALLGTEAMATSRLRADGRGRHTTTHREMFRLPNGAFVIDTPGVKGVGLPTIDGLEQTFDDIEGLAERCRFNDCTHTVEPGCAVLDAIANDELPQRRLDSYRKLLREAAYQARRADARLAAEERARWKSIHKELRRSMTPRP